MLEYERNGVERKYPYCDYEYLPKSHWNYGYADKSFVVEETPITEIPFSSKNPPLILRAKVRKINWGHHPRFLTVCDIAPQSRKPEGPVEEVLLYPYGCAKLRMTEIPLLAKEEK